MTKLDDFIDGKWVDIFVGLTNGSTKKPVRIRRIDDRIELETSVSLLNENDAHAAVGFYFEENHVQPLLTLDMPLVGKGQSLNLAHPK